jgi:hypothetical protein
MPTLTEIQELLDRINLDSANKLKNTREWIGATEVSYVVKRLTDLDCRIVHISDGKNILENCEVFREHFEKVGSPIMYGGGEYAYSIVGINYSMQLGECEFLILDPHYPGQDSLDKVLEKKGLCWRKPEEMFKKGVFYNFCMPIL